jgi:hypothetical protein
MQDILAFNDVENISFSFVTLQKLTLQEGKSEVPCSRLRSFTEKCHSGTLFLDAKRAHLPHGKLHKPSSSTKSAY